VSEWQGRNPLYLFEIATSSSNIISPAIALINKKGDIVYTDSSLASPSDM